MEDHSPEALVKARRLRREMTLPEVLLWKRLRLRPLGIKFRRQHPVGNFIADFYCASSRTVVEVDGIAHDMADRPAHDRRRDDWLKSQGIHVIRISAADILKDCEEVADALARMCRAEPPPSGADAPATSPKGGGS